MSRICLLTSKYWHNIMWYEMRSKLLSPNSCSRTFCACVGRSWILFVIHCWQTHFTLCDFLLQHSFPYIWKKNAVISGGRFSILIVAFLMQALLVLYSIICNYSCFLEIHVIWLPFHVMYQKIWRAVFLRHWMCSSTRTDIRVLVCPTY